MKNKIFFIIFMITWIGLVVFNFFIPKETFSEQENRYLATVPKFKMDDLVSGEYAEGLDTYINDHFVARNFWLKLNSFVQISEGKTENNGVYIGKDNYLFEKFEYGEKEKNNIDKTIEAVNEFAQKVDIPVYFLLVPNSIYLNEDKLPDYVEVYNQGAIIDDFYKKCNNKINPVNVINTLNESKEIVPLYYKTDHHMTSEGAYLLYEEYCKTANISATPISDFQKEIVSTEFLGTFDSKAQVLGQKSDMMVAYKNDINQNVEGDYDGVVYNSIFNEDYLGKKDKYSYFLNGNSAKAVIKTNVNNGKKLLVIKDSYAHNVAQFLSTNYEEIHFIDPRYYKLSMSEYIQENGITETLFLYNVSNITTDISLRIIK